VSVVGAHRQAAPVSWVAVRRINGSDALVRVKWSVGFCLRLSIGLAIIAAALLGWFVFHWPNSLNIAIVIMGGFIEAQTVASVLWANAKVDDEAKKEAEQRTKWTNPWADVAKLSITTQGLVLGLISFAGLAKSHVTVKIGAASLAFGVLVGSSMYLLVARVPPLSAGQKRTASLLVSLLLYALGFGLLCVVTGSWSAEASQSKSHATDQDAAILKSHATDKDAASEKRLSDLAHRVTTDEHRFTGLRMEFNRAESDDRLRP
jgi:hypothetical protein